MSPADLFSDDLPIERPWRGTVVLEETVSLNRCVVFTGDGPATLKLRGGSLKLEGMGPFVFRGLVISAEPGTTVAVTAVDAGVFFEDCTFQGAIGLDLDGIALRGRGRSRLEFVGCRFDENDTHLLLEGQSSAELRNCQLTGASGDGVRIAGRSWLRGDGCTVKGSGWTGLRLEEESRAALERWEFQDNRQHGLSLEGASELSSRTSTYQANGQHGLVAEARSVLLSRGDRFSENGLCGLDLADTAQALLREARADSNGSHGVQMRLQARARLDQVWACGNAGSGLAVFEQARLQAEQFHGISNRLNGAQCAGSGSLTLNEGLLKGNLSSALALFGRGRSSLSDCQLADNRGYGIQLTEEHTVTVKGGQILENRRGGVLAVERSQAHLQGVQLTANGLHGLAAGDSARLTLAQCRVEKSQRDGVLLLSKAPCELLECCLEGNGRNGLFAASESRPLWADSESRDNGEEQLVLETAHARRVSSSSSQVDSAEPLPAGVTITSEEGTELHLPFQPKKIERRLLEALMRHGRLSEMALGKAAQSRRVGGAIENLIDRLNRAGLPLIRHDGDGPEGNVYALRLDTGRRRQAPSPATPNRTNIDPNINTEQKLGSNAC